jgi:predicted SprT family Zn-dependent metalloprotease
MQKSDGTGSMAAEIDAALLRELRSSYQALNASHFKRALRPAAIRLSENAARLGQWDADMRTIEMSRPLLVSRPWGTVLEVLKHEMAHQYVHEVLGRTSDPAHGPAFRDVCERLGIDARASGIPKASASQQAPDHLKILERVSQLLALAQSSNANEAQAATSVAQKLMLKYNLEAAALGSQRGYHFRHLGEPSGRITESERLLSIILGDHFFVEVIWVPVYRPLEQRRGQMLEICGTRPNIDMAAYVHAFLSGAAERLWLEHKRAEGITSNRERRTYLAGVMEGFREKLEAAGKKHRQDGLVWIGDADLETYYRKRHPHIRHTRHSGYQRTEAHVAGRSAGRRLVLHRGMTSESARPAPPKLPPARRS